MRRDPIRKQQLDLHQFVTKTTAKEHARTRFQEDRHGLTSDKQVAKGAALSEKEPATPVHRRRMSATTTKTKSRTNSGASTREHPSFTVVESLQATILVAATVNAAKPSTQPTSAITTKTTRMISGAKLRGLLTFMRDMALQIGESCVGGVPAVLCKPTPSLLMQLKPHLKPKLVPKKQPNSTCSPMKMFQWSSPVSLFLVLSSRCTAHTSTTPRLRTRAVYRKKKR